MRGTYQVRNCTGAESVGVGREWDTSTSRSTSTSADHKGDQLYANQQCGRAVTTRCFCGVTCNCDPPTEEDWTDVFNPRSRSKSYQHVRVVSPTSPVRDPDLDAPRALAERRTSPAWRCTEPDAVVPYAHKRGGGAGGGDDRLYRR